MNSKEVKYRSILLIFTKVEGLVISSLRSKSAASHNESLQKQNQLEDDVNKEVVMVSDSNTIIDPWTMMIKSLNASMTNATMTTASCSHYLTIGT
jgi:hypothetical protein